MTSFCTETWLAENTFYCDGINARISKANCNEFRSREKKINFGKNKPAKHPACEMCDERTKEQRWKKKF